MFFSKQISQSFFLFFFIFIMLPFFLPQIETQMRWKKISIEIKVKMKSNHSFICMVNDQKTSSLFQKLAKTRKRVFTLYLMLQSWTGSYLLSSPISLSGRKETKVQGSEEICPKSLWPMTRNHFFQYPGNVCSAPFHCICSRWVWGEWKFVQDPYHASVTILNNVRRYFKSPSLKWFLLCLYKPEELSRHHLYGSHGYY